MNGIALLMKAAGDDFCKLKISRQRVTCGYRFEGIKHCFCRLVGEKLDGERHLPLNAW